MSQNLNIRSHQTVSDKAIIKTTLKIGKNVITPEEVQLSSPVTFSWLVTFNDEVNGINLIKTITCDACEYEHPGFQFDNKTICLECIRDIAIQFRAKESWAENK